MDENRKHHNEEISLFELWDYIKRGFNKIGNTLLSFFAFLVRNIVILIVLVVLGVVIGFFIDKASPTYVRTEAVVTANFGSSNYLYESIKDINYKLQREDSLFFSKMGISSEEKYGFSLEIKPVVAVWEITGGERSFFDMLEENELLSEEERQAVINKSYEEHRLILFHKKDAPAEEFLNKIIHHISANSHYEEVFQVMQESLDHQIRSNVFMLAQIDSLLANYSKNQINTTGSTYTENKIDLGSLLSNRMEMQEETREMQLKKIASKRFLKVIDMNSAQPLEDTSIFDKKIVAIPLVLLGLFFLIHIIVRVNRKVKNSGSLSKTQ